MFIVWKVATHPVLGDAVRMLNHPSVSPYAATDDDVDSDRPEHYMGHLLVDTIRIVREVPDTRPEFDQCRQILEDAAHQMRTLMHGVNADAANVGIQGDLLAEAGGLDEQPE